MRKPDIFDEIILFLRESQEHSATMDISPETLKALYEPPERKRSPGSRVMRESAAAASMPASGPTGTRQPHAAPGTPQKLLDAWEELEQRCKSCEKCKLCSSRTNVVFGDGNRNADLMFIGEGPGADEDAQGLPFVGRAGQLLTKMIAAMQYDRKTEVYIANIVKCRPPGNRNPEPDEAAACIGYLKRQIELVHPKVIILLGAVPLLYLMGMKGITSIRGKWLDYQGIRVMPTFHPAYLLRNPDAKIFAWQDLQMAMKVLGKTPPPPRRRRPDSE